MTQNSFILGMLTFFLQEVILLPNKFITGFWQTVLTLEAKLFSTRLE